jgi:hypothetical protein
VAQTESGKILKHISICAIVKWYRKWMGGVDRFDQFRAYIRLEMRTGKFWHVMLWFLIESALVNAFILYNETRKLSNLPVQYSALEFRIAAVLGLAAEWESMGCVYSPTVEQVVASPNSKMKVSRAGKLRKSFGCDSDLKFKSSDLHLSYLEDIPLKKGSNLKYRQIRCVNKGCKSALTTKWCRACYAPLCFPNCFREYHTQK